MTFQKVAKLDDLWNGETVGLTICDAKLFLAKIDDEIYAYEDRCAHQGVPLSEGKLEDSVITCRAHGWQFDLVTGRGLNPSIVCLQKFPVRIEGTEIFVDLEGKAQPNLG